MLWCFIFVCTLNSVCVCVCMLTVGALVWCTAPSDWACCVCHTGVWPRQSDRVPLLLQSLPSSAALRLQEKKESAATATVLRTHTGVSRLVTRTNDAAAFGMDAVDGDAVDNWCSWSVMWFYWCFVFNIMSQPRGLERQNCCSLLRLKPSIDQLFLTSLTVSSVLLLKYYISTQGIYRSYELLKQSEVVFDAFVVKVKEP